MRSTLLAIAVLGALLAAALGFAAHLVAQDTVALPAVELEWAGPLALPRGERAPRRTRRDHDWANVADSALEVRDDRRSQRQQRVGQRQQRPRQRQLGIDVRQLRLRPRRLRTRAGRGRGRGGDDD